jgi:hypothetical protein
MTEQPPSSKPSTATSPIRKKKIDHYKGQKTGWPRNKDRCEIHYVIGRGSRPRLLLRRQSEVTELGLRIEHRSELASGEEDSRRGIGGDGYCS